MNFELSFVATSSAAAILLASAASSADVPKATFVPQAEAHAEPFQVRDVEHRRYKTAHRLRVAGGVLIGAGSIPLVLGSVALPSVWRRNAEGSVGNGTVDLLVIGAFVVGFTCELVGIPLLVTGLTGPMNPPEQAVRVPRADQNTGGMGLSWSF